MFISRLRKTILIIQTQSLTVAEENKDQLLLHSFEQSLFITLKMCAKYSLQKTSDKTSDNKIKKYK